MQKLLIRLSTAVLLALAVLTWWPGVIYAGSDLNVICENDGPCSVSPNNTPLFNEVNLVPGDLRQQQLTIRNEDNEACQIIATIDEMPGVTGVDLADRMWGAIQAEGTTYWGSVVAGEPQPGISYRDLYSTGTLNLGVLPAGSSRSYTWLAQFDWLAGNEYQNLVTGFDVNLEIACGQPVPSPTPTTPPGNPGGGNPGGGNPGGGTPSAPQCTATAPIGAPVLSVIAAGDGSVTLSWTPVAPVTGYAINFGTTPGTYLYGATVGTQTTFTVTGLTPGVQYYFQVLGVNDCAPGDRSNEASTPGTPLPPGTIVPPPTGFTPENVLGVSTDIQAESQPQVAGASDEVCIDWKKYIPWILLIAQVVIIFAVDVLTKRKESWWKQFVAIAATLASIGIFYWLRECDCFSGGFLAWLCRWYWIVSSGLTILLQVINYAFIEEVSKKPSAKSVPAPTDTPKETT